MVTYRELLEMVRTVMHGNSADDQLIREAARILIEALRAGRLVAYGQPSLPDGAPDNGTVHMPVPLGILLHPLTTIEINNQIAADYDASIEAWLQRRSLAFHDIRFQTAEVLALWPVQTPPTVLLDDLPADWTLIEAMAWIMLRDPAVVRDAAPETMREGGTFYAEHRLPDGRTEMLAETGAPGVGWMRLTTLSVAAKVDNPGAAVLTAEEAEGALLATLRTGKLTAHGKPYGADPRTMAPRDWRGLILHEQQRGTLIAAPSKEIGRRWSSVTLLRDAVVALWPAHGSPSEAEKLPPAADTLKPVMTIDILRAAYRLRVAHWKTLDGKVRAPSIYDDWAWAKSRYGNGVPRVMLVSVRGDLAPPEWKKPGPRRGAIWRE